MRPGLEVRTMTLPDVFQDHDDPKRQYETAGLDANAIAALIAARTLQRATLTA